MVQTVQTELSIIAILQSFYYKLMLKLVDTSDMCISFEGWRFYWVRKWLKKSLEQFTDQMKKAKIVLES